MLEVSMLSRRYDVRRLTDADVGEILDLCRANAQFYQYCEAEPTKEQIFNDMRVAPPGIDASHKYYVGFYHNGGLVAIMDIVDGYPTPEIAYIGFFMMNAHDQGHGIGSAIIREVKDYLKTVGIKAIRLAIDKENPQSTHFWKKNGFTVVREVDRGGWTALVADRTL